MKFEVDKDQLIRVGEWLIHEVYPPIVAEQKKDPEIARLITVCSNGVEYPYEGAIGGGLTYEFTATGLGVTTKAVYGSGTKYEKSIDLTDYSDW